MIDSTRRRWVTVVLLAALCVLLDACGLGTGVSTDKGDSSLAPGATALDPSAFAPGACITFSPTKGNRNETVFLDAGHGGIDPGAVGTPESGSSINEADETLPVELDATALLRAKGFRVVVSRTKASTVVALGSGDVSGSLLTLQGSHDDVAARDVCAKTEAAEHTTLPKPARSNAIEGQRPSTPSPLRSPPDPGPANGRRTSAGPVRRWISTSQRRLLRYRHGPRPVLHRPTPPARSRSPGP